MTDYQLYHYNMTPEEFQVWQNFVEEIREKCENANLTEIARDVINKRLMIHEPFRANKGYSRQEGYYEICDGDRGALHVSIRTHSKEEAKIKMLIELAHDTSYEYVVKNRKTLDAKHQPEWHFYEVIDRIENSRCISHMEENVTWKYDTKYDYRKIWFEMALDFSKNVLPEVTFLEQVRRYEDSMNHHFREKFWVFNVETMEFEVAQGVYDDDK